MFRAAPDYPVGFLDCLRFLCRKGFHYERRQRNEFDHRCEQFFFLRFGLERGYVADAERFHQVHGH